MAGEDSGSPGKYLVGMAIGVALSMAYVRFDFQLPGVFGLGQKVQSAAIAVSVDGDVYNHELPLARRYRALAVVVGQQPEKFIEIDRATGGRFLAEFLRRRAEREARQFKHRLSAYDHLLAQPLLREREEKRHRTTDTEQLQRRMLAKDLKEEAFLHAWLVRRFPDETADQLVGRVLDVGVTRFREARDQGETESARAPVPVRSIAR